MLSFDETCVNLVLLIFRQLGLETALYLGILQRCYHSRTRLSVHMYQSSEPLTCTVQ